MTDPTKYTADERERMAAEKKPHPLQLVAAPTMADLRRAGFVQCWLLRDQCAGLEDTTPGGLFESCVETANDLALGAAATLGHIETCGGSVDSADCVRNMRYRVLETMSHLEAAELHARLSLSTQAMSSPDDQRKYAWSEVRLAKRAVHDALAEMARLWGDILPKDE